MSAPAFPRKPELIAGFLTAAIVVALVLLPSAASAATIGLTTNSPRVAVGEPIRLKGHLVLKEGEAITEATLSIQGPVSFSVTLPIPETEGEIAVSIMPQGITGTARRHHLADSIGYGYGYGYGPGNGTGKLDYDLRWTPTALGDYTARFTVMLSSTVVGTATRPFSVVEHVEERETRGKIEFTGIVQGMPSVGVVGRWTVQGLAVEVTGRTEVKGDLQTGDLVKVEGVIDTDGVVHAKEIKTRDEGEHRGPKAQHGDDGDDDEDDEDHGRKDKDRKGKHGHDEDD